MDDQENMLGLQGNFIPYCPFHDDKPTVMTVNDCKALNFSLDQKPDHQDWGSHAIDVVLYCPYCGYVDIFGVAISAEHHKKIREMVERHRNEGNGTHNAYKIKRTSNGDIADFSWMDAYR